MGKVGTSTVRKSLKQLGYTAIHTHYVSEEKVDYIVDHRQRKNLRPNPKVEKNAQLSRRALESTDKPLVISAVREPIARNISAYFQNIDASLDSKLDKEVDELIEQFMLNYPHTLPLVWFDDEFSDVLGVNVYDHPFPHADGWQLIESDSHKILLLKTESSSAQKIEGLEYALQTDGLRLTSMNIGEDKFYADKYREFKENIRLPAEYLEKMYGSKYAQHFYSQDELVSFRKNWIR
jgi:hypothetical protein